jgi:integrase
MKSHLNTKQQDDKKESIWRKVDGNRITGLIQYVPNGKYYANVSRRGKLYRESLGTTDLEFAKRKLADFKKKLDRTEPKYGKISLVAWLEEHYFPTLRGSEGALAAKQRIIDKVKEKWPAAALQPMRDLRESEVLRFLNAEYGKWSSSYWNSAVSLLRDAFAMAVRDRVLFESPAAELKYRKRSRPIRLTPTYEEFRAIVEHIRSQQFNGHDADESADFIEACGLLGLGQAEVSGIQRAHIDLDSGRIAIFRHKTSVAFHVPIFPQARFLIEKLCAGKKSTERLFKIDQARAALANACRRLELPRFTHRSLRRMFITRAIEKGVDVKVIAQWQGHVDQGVLILKTYSHVRPEHSNRMALLMSDERPENVVPMTERAAQA